jgi:GMP synthase (glutamine-hydrolysing)
LSVLIVNNYSRDLEKMEILEERVEETFGRKPEELAFHDIRSSSWRGYDAVVLSGSDSSITRIENQYRFQEEMNLVRECRVPLLGICFGHQLIGYTYGERVVRMAKHFQGYQSVRILDHSTLFQGLQGEAVLTESHHDVVSRLPASFKLLAQGEEYEVEAMEAVDRPVFGVQFHPERFDDEHPDGGKVIGNFASIVRRRS